MKLWWLGALALAGCARSVTEDDVGIVCFDEAASQGQLTFRWQEPCLSPSVFNVVRSCTALLDEDVITVTSFLQYIEPFDAEDACQAANAMCVVRGLEEGQTYTVVFADGEAEVSGGMVVASADAGEVSVAAEDEICLPE